jgi:hypothetical protein
VLASCERPREDVEVGSRAEEVGPLEDRKVGESRDGNSGGVVGRA